MEREERELVPVPVKRRELKREIEKHEDLPVPSEQEPCEMPRRWYVY